MPHVSTVSRHVLMLALLLAIVDCSEERTLAAIPPPQARPMYFCGLGSATQPVTIEFPRFSELASTHPPAPADRPFSIVRFSIWVILPPPPSNALNTRLWPLPEMRSVAGPAAGPTNRMLSFDHPISVPLSVITPESPDRSTWSLTPNASTELFAQVPCAPPAESIIATAWRNVQVEPLPASPPWVTTIVAACDASGATRPAAASAANKGLARRPDPGRMVFNVAMLSPWCDGKRHDSAERTPDRRMTTLSSWSFRFRPPE